MGALVDIGAIIVRGTVWVSPRLVVPLHHVRSLTKLEQLMLSMREKGWVGRPLVAHKGEGLLYNAWTGSHRHAAALRVGLETIPLFVVDMARTENVTYRHFGIWFGDQTQNPVARLMELDLR